MPRVVTINRPDVIALIEQVAALKTGGNKTEAVALALRALLDAEPPSEVPSLFGCCKGMIEIVEGYDLTEPMFTDEEVEQFDCMTGAELLRTPPAAAE